MGMRIAQCNAQNKGLQAEQKELKLKIEDLETQISKLQEKFHDQETHNKEFLKKLQVNLKKHLLFWLRKQPYKS